MKIKFLVPIFLVVATISVRATVIADWTFETSIPTSAGPLAPEVGSGVGTAVGLGGFSNPAGNGSGESWSATGWGIGDYWQFQVNTVGFFNIGITFDQVGSATGPRDFSLQYSTDGSTFIPSTSYSLPSSVTSWSSGLANTLSSFAFDLSLVTVLNNAPNVYFRLVDNSTNAVNGATVGTGGTDRVDNFTVNGTSSTVPDSLPSSFAALTFLFILSVGYRFRRQSLNV